MRLGNVARIVAVLAAVVAAVGSASSNQPSQPASPTSPYNTTGYSPPPPQEMEPARSLGLWRSTFGAVKIEADDSRGGLESGALQGVWIYQRHGQEVIGYFSGDLRGNVLRFKWQEPSNPPLTGEGYIVFDRAGKQYSGRWWSDRRDRVGDWNGWRNSGTQNPFDNPRPEDRNQDPYRGDDRRDPNYDRDRDADPNRDSDPYEPAPAPAPRRRAPAPQPQPTYY